ncbi:WbqC family protein [Spirosoma rhododendri]|uniref:WbqC family protein n=1 Tax=Spirosoma rhododendri TaxID=2728024 RepID=A0A7L5DQ77_9BACT|nr:WbqC family protein [Spirosoma rhododendri]QJD80556.1 WbqC family protein [Spirosoma rhododendri]
MEKYQLSNQKTELLIELQYLPCLDYLAGIQQFERVSIEAKEHYQKQSYRNRCYVRTANKVEALTVPVLRGTHHLPIRDLRIDTEQRWQQQHWRTLTAAYARSPFFEYYAPELAPIYERNWTFLFDLNWELLTICLKLFQIKTTVSLTEWYQTEPEPGQFDARSRLSPQNRAYEHLFGRSVPYMQNFGPDFVPNLSGVDLLFCQGPAAREYLVSRESPDLSAGTDQHFLGSKQPVEPLERHWP